MMDDKRILVATIGAPHGVSGEVRLKSHTEDPLAFAQYGPLCDDQGTAHEVLSARLAKSVIIVRFREIDNRDAAQALTGKKLFAARSALPDPDETDQYYLADLIGLQVLDLSGQIMGKVVLADDYGAGGVVEIAFDNGQREMFAFTQENFPRIDLQAGTIQLVAPVTISDREER
jgi:16S rRNA processing protein RimM